MTGIEKLDRQTITNGLVEEEKKGKVKKEEERSALRYPSKHGGINIQVELLYFSLNMHLGISKHLETGDLNHTQTIISSSIHEIRQKCVHIYLSWDTFISLEL